MIDEASLGQDELPSRLPPSQEVLDQLVIRLAATMFERNPRLSSIEIGVIALRKAKQILDPRCCALDPESKQFCQRPAGHDDLHSARRGGYQWA